MVPFSLDVLLAALDNVDGLALQVHQNFKPIYCTRDYARIFGFASPSDFVKMDTILEIVPVEHHEEAKRRYQMAVEQGYSEPIQIKSQRPGGEVIWIRVQDQLMYQGDETYMLTFIEDITNEVNRTEQLSEANLKQKKAYEDLQLLQSKLLEQEKIASLRNVVVGVAHEINTPIGVVRTSVSCIQEMLDDVRLAFENKCLKGQDFADFLETLASTTELMERNLSRTAELVDNFKLVATKEGDKDCVSLNLANYIRDIAKTHSNELESRNITLNLDLEQPWPALATNPNAWAHIVSNLISNAMDHGLIDKENGEIGIRLQHDDSQIHLSISDDGVGMPEEVRKMAFDPFFTTKRGNTYTGLGLYVTYNLVTQSLGGTIDCKTAVDKGCELNIHVPLSQFGKCA